tara:strand:- start:19991 stop:20368 length:378 start_codon:yes stop_codon:yes gene_type:complete
LPLPYSKININQNNNTMIWAWLLNSVSVYATASLLEGVEIKNFWSAVFVAAVLAIINILIKPVLLFLSLPVTILTLGLFVLVINAILIMLVDKLVEGFKVESFSWALIFGVVMSLISWALFKLFG